MDEEGPTLQRARATLTLESTELVWPEAPRGLARLESLDEAPLVAVNLQCARGGPVIHVMVLDRSPPTPAAVLYTPSLPGAQEPAVTVEPGRHREHAVGVSPPLSLPGPGRYAIHVEYAWEGGAARSEPVEVRVRPGPFDAIVCRGLLGGTASPSLCLLAARTAAGDRSLRLATIVHDGPPAVGSVVALGDAPQGTGLELSIPPQSLPTRQYVAYVEGHTLHAIVHAHGRVARLEQELPEPGWQLLGPPVEDRFEDGRLQASEALLVRDDPPGWALRVASLEGAREPVDGPAQPGPAPRVAQTVAERDGGRITLAFTAADERSAAPVVHGHVIRWREAHDVITVEPLGVRPGTTLAVDLVAMSDRRAVVGAVLLRAPDRRSVELHVLEVGPALAPERRSSWARELEAEVVGGVVRLDSRGRPHVVLETHDGRLHHLDPAGERRELGRAAPPHALVLAEERVPVLLGSEPGVGLRMQALGSVPRVRGPA